MSEPIEAGSRVTLHYSLAFATGDIVETTFGLEPMTFIMGDGTFTDELEMALADMPPGERHAVSLPPNLAFGFPDPDARLDLPLDAFDDSLQPEPGLIMGFTLPTGEEVPGTILSIENGQVVVDFNHPLAGQEVLFEAEILEVVPPARAMN